MAKYIKLYHNIFEGVETTYKCLRFDTENSVLNTDFTITSNRTYTNSATGNTVKRLTVNILSTGFDLLYDFENDRTKTILPEKIEYVYDSDSGIYKQSNSNSFSPVEIGSKPSDWESTANYYKYFGNKTTYTSGGNTYEYYANLVHSNDNIIAWNSATQYYKNTTQKKLYFTYGKMKFGVATFATQNNIYTTAFYSANRYDNSINDGSLNARSNGFSGNVLHAPSHTFGSAEIVITTNNNTTLQMCYFEYENEKYYGVAIISRDISNIITEVKLLLLSEECWIKDTSRTVGYGADSEAEGGNGTYDDSSDNISTNDDDANHIGSWFMGSGSGLTYYALTGLEFKAVTDKLYNTIFKDYTNCVTSCILLPAEPNTVYSIDTTVKLGTHDTGIHGLAIYRENIYKSFGTAYIDEYFGTYNDYIGTDIEIYLPFCSSIKVPSHSCVGGAIGIYCDINIITGDIVYKISCVDRFGIATHYYQSGNCAKTIAISGSNNNEIKQIFNAIGGLTSAFFGNYTGLISTGISAAEIATNQQNISIRGLNGGNAGCYGCLYPYINITRVVPSTPEKYDYEKGRDSDIYTQLSNVSGFTQVSYCKLSLPNATKKEIEAIEKQLKEGVIF